MLHSAAADLGLHCLPMSHKRSLGLYGLNGGINLIYQTEKKVKLACACYLGDVVQVQCFDYKLFVVAFLTYLLLKKPIPSKPSRPP